MLPLHVAQGPARFHCMLRKAQHTSTACCPIVWKSHTLKRVVRSTLASETSAMIDALDSAFEAISVMFSVAHLSKEEKVSVAEQLHRQFVILHINF